MYSKKKKKKGKKRKEREKKGKKKDVRFGVSKKLARSLYIVKKDREKGNRNTICIIIYTWI